MFYLLWFSYRSDFVLLKLENRTLAIREEESRMKKNVNSVHMRLVENGLEGYTLKYLYIVLVKIQQKSAKK